MDPAVTPSTTPSEPSMAETPTPPMTVHELNLNTSEPSVTSSSPNASTPDAMKGNMFKKVFVPLCVVVVIAGIGTGSGLNKLMAKGGNGKDVFEGQKIERVATGGISDGQVFGSADESTFKDNAEGFLEVGGINGEGSHKLLRAGGVSQTVYLTSSVTDLSKFEGMEIKVWGETFKAQSAGWLMDVGRVKVLSTKGTPPTEN